MRKLPSRCLLLSTVLVLIAAEASAEPFAFNANVTTSGVFGCLKEPACVASGDSVILGTGGDAVMLTFAGIDTSLAITNTVQPVSLGTLSASSTSPTFPTRTNPLLPIVSFVLTLTHDGPVAASDTLWLRFGPGGTAELEFMQGNTYLSLPSGGSPTPGFNHHRLIYSLSPFEFSIPMNGSVDLTADVGAVPEPATLLLVGFGLAGAAARRLGARSRSSH
jgi:hypothetical protein